MKNAWGTLFLLVSLVSARAQIVTTVAGSVSGYKDGALLEARFSGPVGIALDSIGNIYICDAVNAKIRKVDLQKNAVTTLNLFTKELKDTLLKLPIGIAINKNGTIFVVDYYEGVKAIGADGLMSSYAGCGFGYKNGPGLSAKFANPTGIALDNEGNVFIADYLSSSIRKIDRNKNVTTFAGSIYGFMDGVGSSARFRMPHDLTLDKFGNVYVADVYNHKIRKISPNGMVKTIAGGVVGFYDGPFGRFNSPGGLVVDSIGNVYVADFMNNKIRKITPEGMVSTVAGSTRGFSDGIGSDVKFNGPNGLALDKEGNIYVTDYYNNCIRKITFEIPFWLTWWFKVLEYISGILLAVLIVVIWYNRKLKKEREKNKLRSQMYELEIKAVKAQMNPHFIFNALNTIQQFILSGENDKAFSYLVLFSKLVRKLLESNRGTSITLETEVDILNRYLEIESLRFKQSFKYKIDVEEGMVTGNINIPHLIVQPFVENAVWHGLLHKTGDRDLLIKFSYLNNKTIKCIVDDNGVGRKFGATKEHGKTSLGMDFITERLALLSKTCNTDCGFTVIDKRNEKGEILGTKVEIKIPIIN